MVSIGRIGVFLVNVRMIRHCASVTPTAAIFTAGWHRFYNVVGNQPTSFIIGATEFQVAAFDVIHCVGSVA